METPAKAHLSSTISGFGRAGYSGPPLSIRTRHAASRRSSRTTRGGLGTHGTASERRLSPQQPRRRSARPRSALVDRRLANAKTPRPTARPTMQPAHARQLEALVAPAAHDVRRGDAWMWAEGVLRQPAEVRREHLRHLLRRHVVARRRPQPEALLVARRRRRRATRRSPAYAAIRSGTPPALRIASVDSTTTTRLGPNGTRPSDARARSRWRAKSARFSRANSLTCSCHRSGSGGPGRDELARSPARARGR